MGLQWATSHLVILCSQAVGAVTMLRGLAGCASCVRRKPHHVVEGTSMSGGAFWSSLNHLPRVPPKLSGIKIKVFSDIAAASDVKLTSTMTR